MIPKNVRPGATAEGLTGEKVSFQIEANGKAFRTLIDGLYSNKVRAVIRELCSNARDSHIEAGQQRPFEVSIPTQLDPTFRVRDYGVSLSHDNVMTLYTTIFRSTKENTNTQTGQLGLGSKSPFAYTDTFSVVAYLNGERRVYVAYLETDGVPCISHVSTDWTIEPDGLEVSFPAKRQDMAEFQRELKFVLLGYPTGTIKVVGSNAKQPEPVLEGETWAIFTNEDLSDSWSSQNYVRMGSVVYPLSQRLHSLSGQHSVIVDIPIGAAEVTASREALSLDDETREVIYQAFKTAEAQITEEVNRLVEEASDGSRRSTAEANYKYGSILPSLRSGKNIRVSLLADPNHNGYYRDGELPKLGEVLEAAQYYHRAQNVRRTRVNRYISALDVHEIDKFILVVDDPSEKLVRRVKRINEYGKSRPYAYVVSSSDKKALAKAVANVKRYFELKDDQIIKSSDIADCPPPPRTAQQRKPRRKLGAGQVWMSRRDGRVVSSIYGYSDRGTHNWPVALRQAAALVGYNLNWDDIFWVNERDEIKWAKEGLLTLNRRLDVVIERKVKNHMARQPLVEAQTLLEVTQQVGRYNSALPVVLEEFFPDIKISVDKAHEVIQAARIAKIDLQESGIESKVKVRVRTLSDEYPLLFQKSARQHYEQYVKAIQASK